MIERRTASITEIKYLLITKESGSSYRDFITVPQEFGTSIVKLIPLLPIDAFQVFYPTQYFEYKKSESEASCLSFDVLFESNYSISNIIEQYRDNIVVFLIDKLCDIQLFLETISNKKNIYFCFLISKDEEEYKLNANKSTNFFTEPYELALFVKRDFKFIFENQSALLELMDSLHGKFVPQDVSYIPFFKAAHINFFIECQITGNYWTYKNEIDNYTQEFLNNKSKESLSKAKIESDERLDILTNQMKNMDQKYFFSLYPKKSSDIEYDFNPIILAFPFINPQSEKLSKLYQVVPTTILTKLLKVEQNRNYIFNKQISENEDHLEMIHISSVARIVYPRLLYIDFLLYLHSTFKFSPTTRFPLISSSIFTELSFFKPDSKNLSSDKSIYKTILKFGKRLSDLTLSQKIMNHISKRSCQVVAISDLPVEWIQINKVPLSITHDVCRIPETNLKTPMALFALNNNFTYTIPLDILSKTLVILGASRSEDLYNRTSEVAISECERMKVNYKRCTGVTDFINSINDIKPDLLIIDCHGGYDTEKLSSYLIVNGEKLSHEDIARISLPIPLVFLSACATSPNYGYVHSITNAFFSNGSFSVSSTYLPIDIVNGTVTYLRLLWNLDKIAKNGDFPNWLSYISYVTRVAFFNKYVEKITAKTKGDAIKRNDPLTRIISEIEMIKDSMITFSSRRNTFSKLKALIKNIEPSLQIDINILLSESMLYTHLGRSDLIQFESWKIRNEHTNNPT